MIVNSHEVCLHSSSNFTTVSALADKISETWSLVDSRFVQIAALALFFVKDDVARTEIITSSSLEPAGLLHSTVGAMDGTGVLGEAVGFCVGELDGKRETDGLGVSCFLLFPPLPILLGAEDIVGVGDIDGAAVIPPPAFFPFFPFVHFTWSTRNCRD